MPWKSTTIGNYFASVAETYPDNELIVYKNRRLTYNQASEEVNRLALGLISLGIGKGDRVVVWLPNIPEFILIWLACAKIGVILVAMNTRYKEKEAEYILEQSQASAIFFTSDFANIDFPGMIHNMCPELKNSKPGRLQGKNLPYLKIVVCIEESGPGVFSYNQVMNCGINVNMDILLQKESLVEPKDWTLVVYTSGTTGNPKGAVHSHDNILKNEYRITTWQRISSMDRRMNFLPPYHIAGSCTQIIGTLMRGACIVLMEVFDPEKTLELVERERCTIMDGIPTHFIMMMDHPKLKDFDLSSLRGGWVGGASVTEEVIMAMKNDLGMEEMVVVYGMTETISVTTFTKIGDPAEILVNTDGMPTSVLDQEIFGEKPGFEVAIFDSDTNERKPAGEEGEIRVKGDIVMQCYYNMPDETQKAIDSDGWFHTGDLGKINDNGYLKVTGRIKDMFIVGGTNAYPAEIEAFISTHPKVKMVQVLGVPDRRLGEVGMAFIEVRHGEQLTVQEIISYCSTNIANYKVPRYVEFLTESQWPLTPTGKVQKFRLKEMGIKKVQN